MAGGASVQVEAQNRLTGAVDPDDALEIFCTDVEVLVCGSGSSELIVLHLRGSKVVAVFNHQFLLHREWHPREQR
ncbi:hypothetical protein ACVLV4_000169 [Rathayibacter agropyri]